MILSKDNLKNLLSSLVNALLVTLLFTISYKFYNINIITQNVEDIGFDVIDKFIINTRKVKIDAPYTFVLDIDDKFMKVNKLYDEDNETTYGYLLPRDKLAKIIKKIDVFFKTKANDNKPKAIFLDYDFSFSSMPYDKELSKEDIEFLNILKKPRDYIIIIPKTSKYNFIQDSNDTQIQQLIKDKKIVFASVGLLDSYDNSVRRYPTYEILKEKNGTKKAYINVSVLMWWIIRKNSIPTIKDINNTFKYSNDVIANRIRIKSNEEIKEEENYTITYSYWQNYIRMSANCELNTTKIKFYKNSIIIVGSTYSKNNDKFYILNVFGNKKLSGVELHANILQTLLLLNDQTNRLSLPISATIIFILYFIISFLVSKVIKSLKISNKGLDTLITILLNIIILFSISSFLLIKYNLWFNWFIAFILFEVEELIDFIKDITPKFIDKIKK